MDKSYGGRSTHPEASQSGGDVWLYSKFWGHDPATRDFIYTHELGHLTLDKFGLDRMIPAAKDLGIDPWDTAGLPYAQFNMDEAFADCFASYFIENSELKRRYPAWEALVRTVIGL